jgi:segregation and condensation protein A
MAELVRACLKLLQVPVRERVWQPRPPRLWRAPEALARLRALLPGLPEGAALEQLLPPVPAGKGAGLWQRSAPASTLLAGLELSRDGAVLLEQEAAFKTVLVHSTAARHMMAAEDAESEAVGCIQPLTQHRGPDEPTPTP